jgi:hypothetical protein
LAREAHFPATIADLYDSDTVPADARRMSATTRCWNASISAAGSATTPSTRKAVRTLHFITLYTNMTTAETQGDEARLTRFFA